MALTICIAFGIIYYSALYYYLHFRKKAKKVDSTSSKNSDVSDDEKPYVLAMPKRYIVNVIKDVKEIDIKQQTDIAINISELLEMLNQKNNPKEIKPAKVFFKDMKFNELKKSFKSVK